MNLQELKEKVDNAISYAVEVGEKPKDIPVSIQIDVNTGNRVSSYSADDIELHYDNDGCASGCAIVGNG